MATQEKGISRNLKSFSKYASLIVMVIGGLGLCGWAFDIQNLKSVLPGLATIKVNTAISFILGGIALNLKYDEKPNSTRLHHISQACSFIVTTLALLTLGEYIFKQDLLIDQLIFKDLQTPDSFYPGRMSITAAINFALLGIALLVLNLETRQKIRPAQFLALIAGAIAFIALIGYLYGVESLYSIGIYSSLALHTAFGFVVLSIGVLCARPEQGIMEVITSDTAGGASLRRLLPIAVFILIVIGWLRLWGQRARFYDTNFGLALMVMLSAASLCAVIWLNAKWLNRIDSERTRAVESSGASEERYRRFFENMHETFVIQEIITDDAGKPIDLRYLDINPAGERFLGKTRNELVGRSRSEVSGQSDPEGVEMASRVASTGTPFHMVRYSPGFARWFESFTYSLGSGLVATMAMDITERKHAEQILYESEQRFRALIENSRDAIALFGADGTILYGSPSTTQILGYKLEEFTGRNAFELIHPEDQPYVTERLSMSAQRPRTHVSVYARVLHKNGEWRWLEGIFTNLLDEPGVQAIVNNYRDITESRQAEEKIAYQAHLLENVNDAVIGSDQNSILRFWNRGAERMFGWKAEEVLGRSSREILRSEIPGTAREEVLKILAENGLWKGEALQYRKDGSQVIIEVSTITLRDASGQITGYVSVNRDISERKKTEEMLQISEERFRLIVNTALDAVIVMDAMGHITEWNAQAEAIFGWSRAEVKGHSLAETVIPADLREAHRLGLQHFLATGEGPVLNRRIDVRALHRTGETFPAELTITSLKTAGTYTFSAFVRDITERKRTEELLQQAHTELELQIQERAGALSEANSLLQTLMDNMPDHIYFKDADSRFIRNSKSQAKMMGLSDPAEVIGKTDFDFFPQAHAQRSYDEEQKLIKSNQPLVNIEERVVWPDGRVTWVSTTKLSLRDKQDKVVGTFGISRDITQRKHAEQELLRSNTQLEAANKELEAFSYSVSHDLRAPLRTIDGFSQAIMEDYGGQLPEQGRDDLKRVRKAAQHMAQLIDDLLNLSKVIRAPMKSATVDLTRLAQGIIKELQRAQPERNVRFTSAPNLKIHGDPLLLQVMLENLLNNAWKFTSKRERAEIEFGSKRENEETIYFIRDNGAGFDMAYTSKLFGAFQRLHAITDFPGTGVGLATVQRIIHRHGGRIWAEAEVDQGATFFFTLPPLERAKSGRASKETDSIVERAKEII